MTYDETKNLPIPFIVASFLALMVLFCQPNPFVTMIALLMAGCTFWSLLHSIGLVNAVEACESREDVLVYKASHDPLTGLLNRAGFDDLLATLAARENECFAVVCVDLDGFKAVNDELGHAAGDEILIETGRRLDDLVRQGDFAARLGGDEFALVIPRLAEIAADVTVDAVCKRVVELCQGFHVGKLPVTVSASVGAAIFPMHGKNADELVRHADEAMYAAKRAGKCQYTVYNIADKRHKPAA